METAKPTRQSLYERLGGEKAIRTAVHAFYFNVFRDDRVAPLFVDVDGERLLKHQNDFLAYAFGGPKNYAGPSLRKAHEKLVREHGLNNGHFDAIVEILATTLADLDFPTAVIDEATGVVESVRSEVLGL